MKSNEILHGRALDQLKTLDPESVDCCITSPPYWALRDYKQPGQLGLEPTFQEYITKLIEIFNQVKRVLKKEGSCWVNMGDTYAGTGSKGDYESRDPKYRNGRNGQDLALNNKVPGIPQKSLCLIPQRFQIAMVDAGWVCRNVVIWYKPNCMPSSAKDRLTVDFEYLFFFVKAKQNPNYTNIKKPLKTTLSEPDKAWLAAMMDAEGTIGIRRGVYKEHNATYGPFIIIANTYKPMIERIAQLTGIGNVRKQKTMRNFECYIWQATHNDAVAVLAQVYPYLMQKKEQAKIAIALQKTNRQRGASKGHYGGNAWMSQNDIDEKNRLWEIIKQLNQRKIESSGLDEPDFRKYLGCEDYYFETQYEPLGCTPASMERYKYKFSPRLRDSNIANREGEDNRMHNPDNLENVRQNMINGSGRIKRCVWKIPTQPFSDAHFAVFPPALVKTPLLACCPPNGLVLDPFLGSGTVALVAMQNARNFVGIELSQAYIDIAVKRLEPYLLQTRLL